MLVIQQDIAVHVCNDHSGVLAAFAHDTDELHMIGLAFFQTCLLAIQSVTLAAGADAFVQVAIGVQPVQPALYWPMTRERASAAASS